MFLFLSDFAHVSSFSNCMLSICPYQMLLRGEMIDRKTPYLCVGLCVFVCVRVRGVVHTTCKRNLENLARSA